MLESISFESLANEINKAGEDFSEIVGVFGKALFKMKGEEMNYSEIGKRIADQRNDFAHGNIDKEFNGLALLDLAYLEFLIYAKLGKFSMDSLNEK